jgi:4-hydroxy-tetrahydrodipicolinate synthase
MLPPFYYKNVSEEGLFRYFSEVVQRVGDGRLRIYLYHIPSVAVVGITPKLVERLLQAYPTAIAGMKDSSGDWNNTKTFLDAFAVRNRHGHSATRPADSKAGAARTFDIFVGSESFLLAHLRHGGVGTISATANVNPAAIHSLFADSGDEARGREQGKKSQRSRAGDQWITPESLERAQARLDVVREVFSNTKFPSMIAALKQAIAIYREDPGWARVRPPLVELRPEQAKTLAGQIKAIGFAME